MANQYMRVLGKLVRNPRAMFSLSSAVFRGLFYICRFRITQPNTVIKFPFMCHAKVEISGPGKVYIDRGCSVWMNTFEHLVIKTLGTEAEVRIGKNCTLGGLTIRCHGKIFIGDNVLTTANLIQDVMIVSRATSSPTEDNPESASTIRIGNNVWLGGQSLVLTESSLGDGSVAGVNGLVYDTDVKDNCIVAGNPAMRPVPIDKIVKLQGSPV